LSPSVVRDIDRGRVPVQVATKLQIWVDDVKDRGLEEVRKTPGYHDEPLKGSRAGQRSIRLNKTWRAIYDAHGGVAKFVQVEEVTPHKY
jgi:proteic killer suppression protein